ncbi:phosphopantothenoylcysteine decarboxylase-like [Chironomus tepperi]|uniref:phosphopantothenoylcysteine decarboxylase-like n=1 Tax=Chironomus tepperi TaxID=113505 RepID=UPI00391F7C04
MFTQQKVMAKSKNILIGCTGSVAAIKLPNIISELKSKDPSVNIRVVLTNKAQQFVSKEDIAAEVFLDEHEWSMWKKRGDPVLHIDLVKWADIFVIAPLDANTLGKISSGICDNLLTCVARAWDLEKPLVFCPAMNTKMFLHPITRKQIEELKEYGYIEIRPISKTLMCGDTGMGAMAEYTTVVDITFAHLNSVKFERQ